MYQSLTQHSKHFAKLFWVFTLIHAFIWVILPTWQRYALPHDTIEGALWGQHLMWGYDKNPWMNAWLTRLGWELGGTSGLGIYALSSIFVAISFWAVWKLGQKVVMPIYALIGVLLLEGCINYTLVPQGFNDNVIELGLWPLMFYCFYLALEQQQIRYWIATGIVAGLALMAKYFTGIPLIIMGLFLFSCREGRISFSRLGLYAGLLSFIIIILPHLIWLWQNQFITLKYAFNRTALTPVSWWIQHLYYPVNFAFSQLVDFCLPIILLLLLYLKSSVDGPILSVKSSLSSFNKRFLIYMGLGPFILTILLAILFGWRLYNEWGVPLVALWGLLFIAFTQPSISTVKFKQFLIIIYCVMLLWAIGYAAGLLLDKKHKHSDNYPAQDIANYATQLWWDKYHKPLKYVAGSRYIAGYIVFYSKDHPSAFVEWNEQYSPWIDINAMKKYGALFIQDNYYGTTVFGPHPYTNNGKQFPPEVLQQYPQLQVMPVKYFAWQRASDHLSPIPVLIGFLPPEPH